MLFHVENCKNKLYMYYYDFINWYSITTSEIFNEIFNKPIIIAITDIMLTIEFER
jgi:hypothetical protein